MRRLPADEPVVEAEGLVLRAWREDDVPTMVALFDTAEMDRWTPLPSPFDEAVARAYVERARASVVDGTWQLAITVDGGAALGEVLLFPTEHEEVCELAYAVGASHRGRSLAARAVRGVLGHARQLGYERARLRAAGSARSAAAPGAQGVRPRDGDVVQGDPVMSSGSPCVLQRVVSPPRGGRHTPPGPWPRRAGSGRARSCRRC